MVRKNVRENIVIQNNFIYLYPRTKKMYNTYVLIKDNIIISETECAHCETAIDEFSLDYPIYNKGYEIKVKQKPEIDYDKIISRFKS